MLDGPINPDRNRLGKTLLRWIDDDAEMVCTDFERLEKVDWLRIVPFLVLHLACLGVIWVGWSWAAVGTALGLYVIRGLAISGGYHRYFRTEHTKHPGPGN
jgi:stearoyl-CoA desaturase (Delta-9 desaturase)